MGCIHSTPPQRIPPSPALVAEDEKSPRVFKSRSLTSKSHSSPKSSIEIRPPILSTIPTSPPAQPPEPQLQLNSPSKSEPDLPTTEINNGIQSLLTAITEYEYLTTDSRERTLSELNAILEIVSEDTLVYTKLQILTSHITTSYHNQHAIFTTHLQALITSLPSAWSTFLSLSLAEQQHQAKTQPRSSPIMEIFSALVDLRKWCEAGREIDERFAQRMKACFEEILGELKSVGPAEAAMKWRVLGMVGEKRKEGFEGPALEVLRLRMSVSKWLMEVVDVLGECD